MSFRYRMNRRKQEEPVFSRITFFRAFLIVIFAVIAARLFQLQIISHKSYSASADYQHSISKELFPERGEIYLNDPKAPDGRFPIAVNKTLTTVFADMLQMSEDDRNEAVRSIAPILEMEETELLEMLADMKDQYIPIRSKLDGDTISRIKELDLTGVGFTDQSFRFYPEGESTCHLTGFVGSNESKDMVGRYGIEGHWEMELAGEKGYLKSEKDPVGRLIATDLHDFSPARDGADILLTVDRNIQFVACGKLEEAVVRHGASSGSVVILEPKTGRVMAICGYPSYDPNKFSAVSDMSVYNNPATYHAYEPGSVFKPLTMAAAIDSGKVTPNMTYEDTGEVKIGQFSIRNSDDKAYGIQTMTQILEKSLNTGAIFVVRQIDPDIFRQYVEGFGFGELTGIEIDSEVKGDISSLYRRGDIWSATASFGQGITVTPIQMATAFAALANDGKVMKPHLVEEVRYPDGTGYRTEPIALRQVISKRAADLVSGMLVQVVENGHGKRAGVPGYWVAGKTGTAQISRSDGEGYEKDQFVGTFVGFAPVDNPAFVILTRIDRPQGVSFAESTAAPLFGEIAAYLLQYLQIPPDRPIR